MDNVYIEIVALILLVVVLKVILIKVGRKNHASDVVYQYKKKDFLLTKSERDFFNTLVAALGEQYYVFPQLHLPTFLEHKMLGQKWIAAFRHIDEKSVDYIICDRYNIKPILAVELDDISHNKVSREVRDKEVERILKTAGLPLLRFASPNNLSKEEINSQVTPLLNSRI
jgi:very-short-patch-repair endonuclease